MKIVTFNSLKGGVGKTTLLYSFSNELIKRNKRVLVIDLDSQCNTSSLYEQEYNVNNNVYKMFKDKDLDSNVLSVKYNLDIVPGDIKTSILSNELINSTQREQIFFKVLKNSKIISGYDYVLIDTHPDFSLVTQNALIVSDMIISPIIPNQFSYQSIELLTSEWNKFIEDVGIGNTLILLGNNIKLTTTSSKDFVKTINKLKDTDDYNFFETLIPSSEVFNKITLNKDVIENYPKVSKVIEAISKFVDEVEGYLE